MKDSSLDKELIDYYSGRRLSTTRLAALLEQTREIRNQRNAAASANTSAEADGNVLVASDFYEKRLDQRSRVLSRPRLVLPLSMAAVFAMIVLTWLVSTNQHPQAQDQQMELARIMLREAAVNHQTKLQLEYEENDLDVLRESMAGLDFDLKLPDQFASSHKLIGGRYCTIGGNLAVHLRLEPRTDQPQGAETPGQSAGPRLGEQSVFVTRETGELAGMNNLNFQSTDQVSVSALQSDGLFYLVAQGGI